MSEKWSAKTMSSDCMSEWSRWVRWSSETKENSVVIERKSERTTKKRTVIVERRTRSGPEGGLQISERWCAKMMSSDFVSKWVGWVRWTSEAKENSVVIERKSERTTYERTVIVD